MFINDQCVGWFHTDFLDEAWNAWQNVDTSQVGFDQANDHALAYFMT